MHKSENTSKNLENIRSVVIQNKQQTTYDNIKMVHDYLVQTIEYESTISKNNIYNIYETSPDDSDFYTRDTKGKREISLTTCTDNSKARLIIWAVEE